jgi:TonB family protein
MFGSLLVDSERVKLEVSSAKIDSTSFQSKLRSLPKTIHTPSESGDSYVFTEKEGVPGSDIQSLYVGMIQERIYKNWREPLAEEHNQETVVSFFIFPHGNVDKPFVKKSSGVEALDTLAVRAVLDSVPFPEFPKELKLSNLNINIYFKYVPKD